MERVYVTHCDNPNATHVDIPKSHIAADRLTLLMLFNQLPHYLFQCKLAALSKTSSTVISSINDIRPIGILPTIWKAMERSIKQIMNDIAPSTI